jgi:DNA-binding XRE family transcriptional regulator
MSDFFSWLRFSDSCIVFRTKQKLRFNRKKRDFEEIRAQICWDQFISSDKRKNARSSLFRCAIETILRARTHHPQDSTKSKVNSHQWGRLPVELLPSYRNNRRMPIASPNAPDNVLVNFGTGVRIARKERKVTQEELALKSGIDRSYLGAIERGDQNAGLLHIARIAKALDMTIAELMMVANL